MASNVRIAATKTTKKYWTIRCLCTDCSCVWPLRRATIHRTDTDQQPTRHGGDHNRIAHRSHLLRLSTASHNTPIPPRTIVGRTHSCRGRHVHRGSRGPFDGGRLRWRRWLWCGTVRLKPMPDKLNRPLVRVRPDVTRLPVHSDRLLVEGQTADVAGDPGQVGADLGIGRDQQARAAPNVSRERLCLSLPRSQPGGVA
jgi:hypothetical protein